MSTQTRSNVTNDPVQGTASKPRPRMREWALLAAGAVLGLVLIIGVWMLSGRSGEPGLPAVAEVNRPAPDFVLPAQGGGEVRLADYRGKVVLVNFWGTWCEPCKEETPALQQAYERLRGEGLVVVGVNLTNQEGSRADAKIQQFVDSYGVTYPIALDTDGSVASDYRLYPIPTSYIVDPQGNIRFIKASVLTASEIEALFRRLSAEPAAG